MCCPTHCASYCGPCQALLRALSGSIRSPPPTVSVTPPKGLAGMCGLGNLRGVENSNGVIPTYPTAVPSGTVLNLGKLLHRNVQRSRGGLVCKAHIRLYHSTLVLKVIKKTPQLWPCISASKQTTPPPPNPSNRAVCQDAGAKYEPASEALHFPLIP